MRLEIDVRGQILLARIGQHRREAVAAHRLQRVAGRASLMAVIDDAAPRRRVAARQRRDRRDGFVARRRGFDDLAVAVEGEAAGGDRHPPLHAADMLADRQRVEEFVGDQQQRPRRAGRRSLSCQCASGIARLLQLAQHRAGFDEMDLACETRRAHHAQRIGGQRAAARPELGIDRVLGRPGARPAIGQRRADHFAEHLADFRRGGEIAARAQRIARRIIISVARFHDTLRRVIGPSAAIRSRSARSSGVTRLDLRRLPAAIGVSTRTRPLLRGQHQVEAAEDHRQRQPLAHVQVRSPGRTAIELAVRLADELDAEAEAAVEEDERADELARLVSRLGPPEHPGEDGEQHDAFEHGLVKLARVARRAEDRCPNGVQLLTKRIAQGTVVGAPHSSWLTKLASRPKNRPNGTQQAT